MKEGHRKASYDRQQNDPTHPHDVRHVVSCVDDPLLRQAAIQGGWTEGHSLLEFAVLSDAEVTRAFADLQSARRWALEHATRDHSGTPRVKVKIWSNNEDRMPNAWPGHGPEEWLDGTWQPIDI